MIICPPKPENCNCGYPQILNRNTTLHANDCPAHFDIMEQRRKQAKMIEVNPNYKPKSYYMNSDNVE